MFRKCLYSALFILLYLHGYAQDTTNIKILEKRIEIIEKKLQQQELENLKHRAEGALSAKTAGRKHKIFKGGQRSLQALNPEISFTGDSYAMLFPGSEQFDRNGSAGFYVRGIGMHIQANPDPFSRAKIAIGFSPSGVALGEAYLTWNNLFKKFSLSLGKFRQQFGVVNRWHEHALDQFAFPLALQTLTGSHGINQTGLSLRGLLPSFSPLAQSFTLEITNGENSQLFSGTGLSFPVILFHLKNYYDISSSIYMELGITGMTGKNSFDGFDNGVKITEEKRYTNLGGMDFTVFWEPVNRSLYRSLLWRSELYYVDKELLDNKKITARGGYSYLEYRTSEKLLIGFRYDFTQPFTENNEGSFLYQIVPYITVQQSHWVKIRLQYIRLFDNVTDTIDDKFIMQWVWAIGPHKHDRY